MPKSVIISINNTSHKEAIFVQALANDLTTHNIDTLVDNAVTLADGMRQQTLTAQWLVLVLTPEAIRSPQVKLLVNTALHCVKQGQMRGVVALTFLSDPIEPDDMPDPLWYTIRTYYVGESPEDQRLAFSKIARLAGPVTPVRTASPVVNDWTSLSTSHNSVSHNLANSRSLPAAPKPAQKSYFKLMALVSGFTLVLGLILGIFATLTFQEHLPHSTSLASSTSNTSLNTRVITKAQATGTAKAQTAGTAQAQAAGTAQARTQATATATKAQTLYNVTTKSPTYNGLTSAQDENQWNTQNECAFTDGQYQISVTPVTHPTVVCQAQNTSFINFAYQVQMTLTGNEEGGLIFRSDGIQNFYRFSLNDKGHYILDQCQSNPCPDPTTNSGNQVGDGNLLGSALSFFKQNKPLTIIVDNKDVYFYINGTFVKEWSNIAFGSGTKIGMFAASNAPLTSGVSTTQVTFNNVKVWTIS